MAVSSGDFDDDDVELEVLFDELVLLPELPESVEFEVEEGEAEVAVSEEDCVWESELLLLVES